MPIYLKEWREHQGGMTQEDLATKAGLARSAIASIEAGRTKEPRASTVARLSRGLGLEPGEELRKPPPGSPNRSRNERAAQEARTSETEEERLRDEQGLYWRPRAWEGGNLRETSDTAREILASRLLARGNNSGLRMEQLEALVFVTLVEHLLQTGESLMSRPHQWEARAHGLRSSLMQVFDDAVRVARVLFMEEFYAGGLLGWSWLRDTGADEVREIRRAIERWHGAYGNALDEWLGTGPWWDAKFENNLFSMMNGWVGYAQILKVEAQQRKETRRRLEAEW